MQYDNKIVKQMYFVAIHLFFFIINNKGPNQKVTSRRIKPCFI
ncbi:hypothetical protein BACCELL_03404 [Bacteroides cellulosilyticus DSM 14838]|uniref:Uncharacterized protein n=1 Tax=Bacteroides cellulosilyticus DSM 14838 TaxID=537012 RepID=E2NGH9_9BACE|nr:hypothetical protein BACCELL_03404 [Bacteroides cellulosilyticus DSM 14838]